MSITRGGETVSEQIGTMGVISNLNTQNFTKEGLPFNIKNDGGGTVVLEVNLWGMPVGEFISTKFSVGWSPEIVREIKKSDVLGLELKWGY